MRRILSGLIVSLMLAGIGCGGGEQVLFVSISEKTVTLQRNSTVQISVSLNEPPEENPATVQIELDPAAVGFIEIDPTSVTYAQKTETLPGETSKNVTLRAKARTDGKFVDAKFSVVGSTSPVQILSVKIE